MNRLIIILILFFSFVTVAQNRSIEEINEAINEMCQVRLMDYGGRKIALRTVDTLEINHYLHSFVSNNHYAIDYLMQNQLKLNSDSLKSFVDDELKLKEFFETSLIEDTCFTKSLSTLICSYLSSEGINVSGYSIGEKYEVSMDKIASIVTRFFYPNKLVGGGKGVSMKLCIAALSFKDYDGERDYLEEAFAYSVVMSSAQSENQDLIEEYKKEAKFAINMNMSTEEDVKLNRIQGAVWALLCKNQIVIDTILRKYEEQKNSLPFSITI